MKTASWVIVRLSDDVAIAETFQEHVAKAINKEKYKAVPIMEYLVNLNKRIKEIDNENSKK